MNGVIGIALSGLQAAANRLNASASNIANLQSAGALQGDPAPYTPVQSYNSAQENGGVKSQAIPRKDPFVPAFDPDSPFADENGIIGIPNISLAEEIVNLNLAELEYKANIETIRTAGELNDELLDIFDDD